LAIVVSSQFSLRRSSAVVCAAPTIPLFLLPFGLIPGAGSASGRIAYYGGLDGLGSAARDPGPA